MKKILALMMSVVFILSACNEKKESQENANRKSVVKIGVLLSLTGDAAEVSQAIKDAMIVMNPEFQNKNVVTQLIFEDISGNASKNISAVNKLIFSDKVNVLVSTISSNAKIVSPLAKKHNILHIGLVDNAEKEKYHTTFTHWTTPKKKAEKLLNIMQGDSNIAVIYQNIETQKTLFEAIATQGKVRGIIVDEYAFNSTDTDFRIDLLKIKEKNYDKIVLLMFSPMIDIVARRMNELSMTTPITAIGSFMYAQDKRPFEGIPFVNSFVKQDGKIKDIQEQIKSASTHGFSQMYDVLDIVSNITNAFYDKNSRLPDGKEMTQAILDMKVYDGMSGHLIVEPDRTIQSEASVVKIVDGKPVIIEN